MILGRSRLGTEEVSGSSTGVGDEPNALMRAHSMSHLLFPSTLHAPGTISGIYQFLGGWERFLRNTPGHNQFAPRGLLLLGPEKGLAIGRVISSAPDISSAADRDPPRTLKFWDSQGLSSCPCGGGGRA